MRAWEFVTEENVLQPAVADALPTTYVMPELKSQDPYLQYRFGVAMAGAKSHQELGVDYEPESTFGENMIVVARTTEEEEIVQLALKMIGQNNSSKIVSTTKSEETSDIGKVSPVQSYKRPTRNT